MTEAIAPAPADERAEASAQPAAPDAADARRRLTAMLSLGLFALPVVLFLPLRTFPFLYYDDHIYVTQHPRVREGLTASTLRWALTDTTANYWHPVPTLVHLVTVELFGMDGGGHHLVSVILHAFNVLVLFLTLSAITGAPWRSAAVAALLAWHPLRVESVAWVTEVGGLIESTWVILALAAYAWYVRRPGWRRYIVVAGCFTLALLSKPIAAPLPLALLLLDYWPLKRLRPDGDGWKRRAYRLALEKLPLLALAVAAVVGTAVAQARAQVYVQGEKYTVANRIGNSLVSYVRYLGKTLWPTDLTVSYAHPGQWPTWAIIGSAALLVLLTALAVAQYRRRPYVAVGWLWFCGMFVPMIGLMQVRLESLADRYTYVPHIGLLVAVVWTVAELAAPRPPWRAVVAVLTAGVLVVLAARTRQQMRTWRDTPTLFAHAISINPHNAHARGYVGLVLQAQGRTAEAAPHLRYAIEHAEDHPKLQVQAGLALAALGDHKGAVARFRRALQLRPTARGARHALGVSLAELGALDESAAALEAAAAESPLDPDPRASLADVLARQARNAEAMAHWREALRLAPDHPAARQGFTAARGATRPGPGASPGAAR